ncbi:MAG: FixH family protein [Pseudomonadota bacterium]
MQSMLLTLVGGAVAIVVVFLLLRLRGGDPKVGALAAAFPVVAGYTIWTALEWPGMDVYAMHLAVYFVTAYALSIIALQKGKGGFRFHWAPAIIVAFFGVVISVNAVFLTLANGGLGPETTEWLLPQPESGAEVRSFFPGTVARDYQEKEELYNRYLERVEEQRERGWQVTQGFTDKPVAGQEEAFQVEVLSREGEPIDGATVSGKFLRPANKKLDISFELKQVGPGLYRSDLRLPAPGRWDLAMTIERAGAVHEVHARTRVNDGS